MKILESESDSLVITGSMNPRVSVVSAFVLTGFNPIEKVLEQESRHGLRRIIVRDFYAFGRH